MMCKAQTAWEASDVVTFVLAFEPQQTSANVQLIQDVFVQMAQLLPSKYATWYHSWHASLHTNCRNDNWYAHLWLRFKVKEAPKKDFLERVEPELGRAARGSVFRLGGICVQTERQSFGEGDPRSTAHDVFSCVGGSCGMAELWPQMQTATEWAAQDLPSGTARRKPPDNWFCYACHIYLNLRAEKCPRYHHPGIRVSTCPVYAGP